MTDRTAFAPLVFFEYDDEPGSYCLMLTDDHMVPVADVFEERGQDGNGYDWERVARSVLRERAPEAAERISFGCEAGMFVARSEDGDALRELGRRLREAWHDRSVLKGFIGDR